MADLRIEIHEAGQKVPDSVVIIPMRVLRVAARLLPKGAKEILEEEGIDLRELSSISLKEELTGKLIEVENSRHKKVVVICIR